MQDREVSPKRDTCGLYQLIWRIKLKKRPLDVAMVGAIAFNYHMKYSPIKAGVITIAEIDTYIFNKK